MQIVRYNYVQYVRYFGHLENLSQSRILVKRVKELGVIFSWCSLTISFESIKLAIDLISGKIWTFSQ